MIGVCLGYNKFYLFQIFYFYYWMYDSQTILSILELTIGGIHGTQFTFRSSDFTSQDNRSFIFITPKNYAQKNTASHSCILPPVSLLLQSKKQHKSMIATLTLHLRHQNHVLTYIELHRIVLFPNTINRGTLLSTELHYRNWKLKQKLYIKSLLNMQKQCLGSEYCILHRIKN